MTREDRGRRGGHEEKYSKSCAEKVVVCGRMEVVWYAHIPAHISRRAARIEGRERTRGRGRV